MGKVYEGDSVELIGSCKMEGVSAWVMLPTRPAVLQRIKLPKGGSARYFVGSSGSYHDAGDLPFSPTGYTILGEDGEYIRLASPVIQESGDAIVSSESPQYDVLVAAQLPPEFAVLAPDAAGPLCYYNQETDNDDVANVQIVMSAGAKQQSKKRGHARFGWVNADALEQEVIEQEPLRVPAKHECFELLKGRPNYDKIFQEVREWHRNSPCDYVGVFCCGPMGKQLRAACNKYSVLQSDPTDPTGTTLFKLHAEVF